MHLGLEVKFVFKPPIDLGSAYEMLAVLLPVGMGGKGANNPAIFSERARERDHWLPSTAASSSGGDTTWCIN